MSVEIVTKDDLYQLRDEILCGVEKMLTPPANDLENNWLRTSKVRKILDVSNATLHNWRENKILEAKRIKGIYYYEKEKVLNFFIDEKE